jgi:hypothetical protein
MKRLIVGFAVLGAIVAAPSLTPAQPMAGAGAGEMPDPRMMSGQARPQEGDPPGRLTVRAVQGKLRVDDLGNRVSDWPKDAVIHLVAYDAKDQVAVESKPVDAEGRAVFDGLATDGSKAYRALAVFRRGAVEDRLIGEIVVMPPMVGMRLMLAGEAPGSTAPAVDDQTRGDDFSTGVAPPAGEVLIQLRGQSQGGVVHLVQVGAAEDTTAEAILQKVVRDTQIVPGKPTFDAALRDRLVQVRLTRKEDPKDPGHAHGAVGATVELREAGAAGGEPIAKATTGGDGVASLQVPPGVGTKQLSVRIAIASGAVDSAPFALPATGGVAVPADVTWVEEQVLQARFQGLPGATDRVYYSWLEHAGRRYLSSPFVLGAAVGASSGIFVYPDLIMGFQGEVELDDQRMFFRLGLTLVNPTPSPRDLGPAGLSIPLPRGFRGASVEETVAARVKVVDQGFVWRGAVPPGQKTFMAGFALDVVDGEVAVDFPLPLGAWQSHLVFEELPGMTVELPPSARKQSVKAPNGKPYTMLSDINIEPGKSLVMRFRGLPQPSAAMAWGRVLAGIAVLALLGWGAFGIFGFRRPPDRAVEERERLFAELVALESRHGREAGGAKASGDAADERRYQAERSRLLGRLTALAEAEERPAAKVDVEPAP